MIEAEVKRGRKMYYYEDYLYNFVKNEKHIYYKCQNSKGICCGAVMENKIIEEVSEEPLGNELPEQ